MFFWIAQNMGNIIVSLILILAVTGIILKLIKDKRAGRSSCGGNCAHCRMCHSCADKNRSN